MKIAYMLGSLNRGGMETLLLDVFKNARIAEYSFIGIHRKGGKYQFTYSASAARKIVRRTAVIFAIGLAIAWFGLSCRTWHALA
ncbi:MAG: hypothetical protein ACFNUT_05350, partial [Bacteroidota bacterium]